MSDKYIFIIEATISLSIEVEAASLTEAVEKAKNSPTMSFCHQCAKGEEGCWSTSGELDTDPSSATLVDFHTEEDPATFENAVAIWTKEL